MMNSTNTDDFRWPWGQFHLWAVLCPPHQWVPLETCHHNGCDAIDPALLYLLGNPLELPMKKWLQKIPGFSRFSASTWNPAFQHQYVRLNALWAHRATWDHCHPSAPKSHPNQDMLAQHGLPGHLCCTLCHNGHKSKWGKTCRTT